MLVLRTLTDPIRVMRNELMMQVDEMEQKGAAADDIISMVAGQKSQKSMEAGEVEGALLACGQVIGLVHDIPTMKELVERTMKEATAIYERLGKTLGKKH